MAKVEASAQTLRGRHSYPAEFKAEAVQLVRRGELTKTQIAKDLGVTIETLTKWAKRDEIDHGQQPGLSSDDREELRRLRRENRVLREEREILKKAAAFFASETNGSPK